MFHVMNVGTKLILMNILLRIVKNARKTFVARCLSHVFQIITETISLAKDHA
jgi:hypothetical protein